MDKSPLQCDLHLMIVSSHSQVSGKIIRVCCACIRPAPPWSLSAPSAAPGGTVVVVVVVLEEVVVLAMAVGMNVGIHFGCEDVIICNLVVIIMVVYLPACTL